MYCSTAAAVPPLSATRSSDVLIRVPLHGSSCSPAVRYPRQRCADPCTAPWQQLFLAVCYLRQRCADPRMAPRQHCAVSLSAVRGSDVLLRRLLSGAVWRCSVYCPGYRETRGSLRAGETNLHPHALTYSQSIPFATPLHRPTLLIFDHSKTKSGNGIKHTIRTWLLYTEVRRANARLLRKREKELGDEQQQQLQQPPCQQLYQPRQCHSHNGSLHVRLHRTFFPHGNSLPRSLERLQCPTSAGA